MLRRSILVLSLVCCLSLFGCQWVSITPETVEPAEPDGALVASRAPSLPLSEQETEDVQETRTVITTQPSPQPSQRQTGQTSCLQETQTETSADTQHTPAPSVQATRPKTEPTPTAKPTVAPTPLPSPTPLPTQCPSLEPEPSPTTQATPGVSPQPTTPPDNQAARIDDMFRATNAVRQKHGQPALAYGNKGMQKAAATRAREIARSFSHTRPDGSVFASALNEEGISYSTAGENIANFSAGCSVSQVIDAWEASEGHLKNMVASKFKLVTIGYFQGEDGRLYWVQLFTG